MSSFEKSEYRMTLQNEKPLRIWATINNLDKYDGSAVIKYETKDNIVVNSVKAWSPISDIEIKINDILVVVINVYIPPTSSFSSGSFSWNSSNRFKK